MPVRAFAFALAFVLSGPSVLARAETSLSNRVELEVLRHVSIPCAATMAMLGVKRYDPDEDATVESHGSTAAEALGTLVMMKWSDMHKKTLGSLMVMGIDLDSLPQNERQEIYGMALGGCIRGSFGEGNRPEMDALIDDTYMEHLLSEGW